MKRYQLYNRLVDISFWLSVAHIIHNILWWTYIIPELGPFWNQVHGIVLNAIFLPNLLLQMFLVAASGMRDEYAEKIWQRAATSFAYFMVFSPWIIILIFAGPFGFWFLFAIGRTDKLSGFQGMIEIIPADSQIAAMHFEGWMMLVILLSIYLPFVFLALYKWQRWRDARS